jgi:hypothetical protein
MTKECTCGDTGYHWLPDENQAEANCWECYYKDESMYHEEMLKEEIREYNAE